MEKELASKLKVLINTPEFTQLMHLYLEYRKKAVYDMLASARDTTDIFRLQGSLSELNNLSRLRDTVNSSDRR